MCKHIFLCSVCNGAASAVCMFDLVGVKVDGFPVRERKKRAREVDLTSKYLQL